MLNSQAHQKASGCASGGQAMQRVVILGSMAVANSAYSTLPTSLQGKSGNPFRLRADWTRRDPAITQALTALGRSGVDQSIEIGRSPQHRARERVRQLAVAYRLKSDAQAGRALDRLEAIHARAKAGLSHVTGVPTGQWGTQPIGRSPSSSTVSNGHAGPTCWPRARVW